MTKLEFNLNKFHFDEKNMQYVAKDFYSCMIPCIERKYNHKLRMEWIDEWAISHIENNLNNIEKIRDAINHEIAPEDDPTSDFYDPLKAIKRKYNME